MASSSQDILRNAVVAETIARMGGQEKLVQELVKQAMEARKDPHSYSSSDTVFEYAFKQMIGTLAQSVMNEWLAEHRETIKAAFQARIRAQGNDLIEQLADAVTSGWLKIEPTVHLKFKREDPPTDDEE